MLMNWKKVGVAVLAVDLLALNVVLGLAVNRVFFTKPTEEKVVADGCDEMCQERMLLQIAKLRKDMAALPVPASSTATPVVPSVSPQPVQVVGQSGTTLPTKKIRSVQYVTIPGQGSSQSMSWQSLSGTEFYFDKSDYPGLTEVYFEANFELQNGNGMGYVRLFDATHKIGVDGSEIQTATQTAGVFSSGRLNFWSGRNLISVQGKTLTADTTMYNYGRLKIVTEN